MQRNGKRGPTPPYLAADFVGQRRETRNTRHLSLTKTQELTDSQTTLERLNPPTADIRVSKSRKMVNDQMTASTVTSNERPTGIASKCISSRFDNSRRPSQIRP